MTDAALMTPGAKTAAAGELVDSPVFLVGCMRSGTTLLRLMLDHHPRISFLYEFEYVVDEIGNDGALPALPAYHEYLRKHRIFNLTGFTIDPSLDYRRLVDSFLRQKRDGDGKPKIGATVHLNFDRLLHIWPDARFIHLARDGRDVGRSIIQMGWAGNMWSAVDLWLEAERLWDRLKSQLPADRWLEVTYEQLIESAEPELDRICRFMGERFDPAIWSYAAGSTYEMPDPKLTYQWKRKLSPHEVQLAEHKIAPMLEARGYALSGHPRMALDAGEQARLARQNRWYKRRYRMKDMGLGWWVADAVARRTGIGWLQDMTLRRENAVINAKMR